MWPTTLTPPLHGRLDIFSFVGLMLSFRGPVRSAIAPCLFSRSLVHCRGGFFPEFSIHVRPGFFVYRQIPRSRGFAIRARLKRCVPTRGLVLHFPLLDNRRNANSLRLLLPPAGLGPSTIFCNSPRSVDARSRLS